MLKYTQWNNFFLISSQKIVCSNSQPDTFILWVPFLGTGRLLLGAPELPLTWCSCCYLLLSPVISCNCGAIPTHGGGCPGRADSFFWLFTSAFHCTQPSQRPVVDAGFNDINLSGFFCLFFVVCLGFVFSVYLFVLLAYSKSKLELGKKHYEEDTSEKHNLNIFNWWMQTRMHH